MRRRIARSPSWISANPSLKVMHGEAPTASSLRHSSLHFSLPFSSRPFPLLSSASVRRPSLPPSLAAPLHPKLEVFCSLARSGRLVGCWRVAKPHNLRPFPSLLPSHAPPSLLFLPFHFFHPSFAFLAATVANIAAHIDIFHSPRPPFHQNRLAFRIHRCLTSTPFSLRLEGRFRHLSRLLGGLFSRVPPHPRLPLKSGVLRRCLVLAS